MLTLSSQASLSLSLSPGTGWMGTPAQPVWRRVPPHPQGAACKLHMSRVRALSPVCSEHTEGRSNPGLPSQARGCLLLLGTIRPSHMVPALPLQ